MPPIEDASGQYVHVQRFALSSMTRTFPDEVYLSRVGYGSSGAAGWDAGAVLAG